jgi:hypothetical protein
MKPHLIKVNLLTIIFLSTVFFSACSNQQNDLDIVKEVLDTNLVKDHAGYSKAVTERKGSDDVSFTIEDVKRDGELVTVTVKGGCAETSFKFIWDGRIAESYPMQAWLVLVHDKGSNQCEDKEAFQLTLNLRKLFTTEVNLEEYVFHIANGSMEQDSSLDPDGAVTITP